jgi:L-serine dehydratase
MPTRQLASVFDLFSIGVGPSSSHTVGPMRAAARFVETLAGSGDAAKVAGFDCDLFASLAATGPGHRTPQAVVAGLAGMRPEVAEADAMDDLYGRWRETGLLPAPLEAGGGPRDVRLGEIGFHPETILDRHVNGMRLAARDASGAVLRQEDFFSVGGGFIESENDAPAQAPAAGGHPYPYRTAEELLARCGRHGLGIADIARANEQANPNHEIDAQLDAIWEAMTACVQTGLEHSGILPGGLSVRRRAARLATRLRASEREGARDTASQWLQAYAMAVGEENAAGGRVVTAPTNGAAGIVPAVGMFAMRFCHPSVPQPHREYLLVAGAIGGLYKRNASISGAEAGCQGEVGSAASMAAAGFAHLLGGTPWQVENAAEIAMEQHLGLTCDPVGGLVQMPCIERNAIAAGTAVAAARLALAGDGTHRISLDTCIETMRQTGADMSAKYKETARAGLAVNVVEC